MLKEMVITLTDRDLLHIVNYSTDSRAAASACKLTIWQSGPEISANGQGY